MVVLQALNAALALAGWRLRTVSRSGALAGWAVGSGVAIALGWPGYLVLLLYFALGVLATRTGWREKRFRGIAEAAGGARGARQVAANGGPALAFAVLAPALPFPAGSLAAVGFVGALATAAADTVSSEIGKRFGRHPRRLPDLVPVPPGTSGGVSLPGSLAGAAAAGLVAGVGGTLGILPGAVVAPVAAAGFAAAFLEGLLAPLETAGVLDNDGVNAISVFSGGLLAAGAGWLTGGVGP